MSAKLKLLTFRGSQRCETNGLVKYEGSGRAYLKSGTTLCLSPFQSDNRICRGTVLHESFMIIGPAGNVTRQITHRQLVCFSDRNLFNFTNKSVGFFFSKYQQNINKKKEPECTPVFPRGYQPEDVVNVSHRRQVLQMLSKMSRHRSSAYTFD